MFNNMIQNIITIFGKHCYNCIILNNNDFMLFLYSILIGFKLV